MSSDLWWDRQSPQGQRDKLVERNTRQKEHYRDAQRERGGGGGGQLRPRGERERVAENVPDVHTTVLLSAGSERERGGGGGGGERA